MMEFHPYANMFPLLDGVEFEALCEDIKQNGLLNAIVLHENKILDGRNRWRACQQAGVEAKYETLDKECDPLTYVFSTNLHRRHLTSSQRACLAVEVEPLFISEAKEAQRLSGQMYGKGAKAMQKTAYSLNNLSKQERTSAFKASSLLKTNRAYFAVAKKIKADKALFERVKKGEINLSIAIKEFNRARVNLPGSIEGKYHILLADPPWSFSTPGNLHKSGEFHYPTMTNEEIADLGEMIRPCLDDTAVLFLWTLSSHLPAALEIMKAWGFEYKSSVIWQKHRGGQGWFGWRLFHEVILIGHKGKAPHADGVWFPSIIKAPNKKHSLKPDVFYDMIEALYPIGNRLELFARTKREGWDCWGNQL